MSYEAFHARLCESRLYHDEWKRALPLWRYRHDELEMQASFWWCHLADREPERHAMNLRQLQATLTELQNVTCLLRGLMPMARKKAA